MLKDYRILSALLIIVSLIVVASIIKAMRPEYAAHQVEYYEKLKIDDYKIEIAQINVQTTEGVLIDRCTTCHIGSMNPDAKDFANPLKQHPPIVPGAAKDPHDMSKIGCAVCHEGNGRGLTMDDAHGMLMHWTVPMLAGKEAQASCAKCHVVDGDIAGADLLNKGRKLFIEKECWTCHTIKGVSGGSKGPELTDAGNKFKLHYLRESILNPKANIESSQMPKFDWVDSEPESVEALAIYLKAQRKKQLRSAAKAPIGFTSTTKEKEPVKPTVASAEYGKQIFHGKSAGGVTRGGCINCHSYAAETPKIENGKLVTKIVGESIGPELTYEFRARGGAYIREHLADPSMHTIDTIMPKFGMLSAVEKDSLVLFLKSLDVSVPQAERKPEHLYAAHCASCHGENFDGKGRVADKNRLLDPLPRNFRNQFVSAYKERFANSIMTGVAGTAMPPWKGILSEDEAKGIVEYIHSQVKEDKKVYSRPEVDLPKIGDKDRRGGKAIIAADAQRGEAKFKMNCTGCHGKLANGKGPNAFDQLPSLPRNLINREFMTRKELTDERIYRSILLGVPGTSMPVHDQLLTDQAILDVIAYLRSLHPDDKETGQ